MKKLGKFLLSICMMFCLTFTLVACDTGEDPGEGGGNEGTTYTPPTGVDMTSASSYAQWLIDNPDYTNEYIATMVTVEDSSVTTKIIKYKYENNIQYIATYDSSNNLEEYIEISKATSVSYLLKIYSPSTTKYSEHIVNKDELYLHRANEWLANDSIMQLWSFEINLGLGIGGNLKTQEGFESVTITETMTNPENGKYQLAKSMTGPYSQGEQTGNLELTYKATVENDKLTYYYFSANTDASTGESMDGEIEITYDYQDVSFSVNTTGYTKAN